VILSQDCGRIFIVNVDDVRIPIEEAMADARESRLRGKEGRARVSARRAAGLAIGAYYLNQLQKSPPRSAYQLLQWFSQQGSVPDELRQAALRLTVRVTPSYELPHAEDPLEDAELLIEAVFGGEAKTSQRISG
jgi:HEPN domain-containing protein